MISQRAKREGIKELEIFDNFQIDENLPKHQKPDITKIDNESGNIQTNPIVFSQSMYINGTRFRTGGSGVVGGGLWNPVDGWNDSSGWEAHKIPAALKWKFIFIGWFKRLYVWFKKKTYYNNIYKFFMDFDGHVSNLNVVEEMANYYQNALQQAKESGQEALVDKIEDLIDVYKYETLLYSMRLTKFVTEGQIYDFYMKKAGGNRALKLTWIKNFTRVIPSDVLEIKRKVDEKKIFDNYVILHYDIAGTSEELTKKEKEIRKDPILFGVLAKSNKLYYIADWKDEVCDLTLETMFEELGENVLKINNKSVKSFMDTGKDERKRSFKRKKKKDEITG